jgi:Tfp pilus assembly PilM family ATPase
MSTRNSLLPMKLPMKRRMAVGIDLNARALRLAVLSQRGRALAPVCVEWLAETPLAGGVMAGAQIVDRAAVASAIGESLAQLPEALAARKLMCAMAVPGSATVVASLELSRVAARTALASRMRSLSGIEPAVLAEAERVAGIERHALAVDWFVDDTGGGPGDKPPSVTIAATPKEHLESRVEAAAAAGVALRVLDGEPPAALRALRHAAELESGPHERHAAVWVGGDGVYGWRIANDLIEAHVRYPAPEHSDLADALRELADGTPLACALVGGEIDLLEGAGLAFADIGDLLGCSALPFECAAFCDAASPIPHDLLHAPAFAVAFGLALRGVFE